MFVDFILFDGNRNKICDLEVKSDKTSAKR